MYSATNDSLVMPSYPLEPTSAIYFKYIQVVLAILMLTQTALPLAGAMVVGTWIYLWRWGWLAVADAIPVVPVGVAYLISPRHPPTIAITQFSEQHVNRVLLALC